MNKYESVIIVNPNLDEAGLKALEDKFTGLINEHGKVESVENMGKKKLAYEIKKFRFYSWTWKSLQNHRWYNKIYRCKKRRLNLFKKLNKEGAFI